MCILCISSIFSQIYVIIIIIIKILVFLDPSYAPVRVYCNLILFHCNLIAFSYWNHGLRYKYQDCNTVHHHHHVSDRRRWADEPLLEADRPIPLIKDRPVELLQWLQQCIPWTNTGTCPRWRQSQVRTDIAYCKPTSM